MSLKVSIIVLFALQLIIPTVFSAQDFDKWKKNYSSRAAKRGIPKNFSTKILADITPDPKVIERDRNQIILSKKHDYQIFIKDWLKGDKRISIAREMLTKHQKLLDKIEKRYGVDKEVIVSIWGVETFYGQIMGDFNVIRSLATLAFDGRRKRFYEIQLNAAMRLLLKNQVEPHHFVGSWAGATGHCQFMPSNITSYAQDFDGDGKKDIWTSLPDTFASIAYLLKRAGWQKGKSIGSLVVRDKSIKRLNLNKYRSPAQYRQLGFKSVDGKKIGTGGWRGRRAATIPMKNSPLILRGSNYLPILKWNRSSLFAAFNIILMSSMSESTSSPDK